MDPLIAPGVTIPTVDEALFARIHETAGPGTRIRIAPTGLAGHDAFGGATLNAFEVEPPAGAVRLP